MIGKTLGHYEVTDKLGQGGMGEVFRARDNRLDREVALKLLPDEVASDPERLARLRREAKVLASLNHSNIAAIYDIEETPEAIFLVMELVEGEDLSVRIANRSLLMHDSLEIARQIADGLQEAHAKGVVHRDLKPANVKVSSDGKATILDFGLARAFSGEDEESDPSLSPTITALHTRAGTILGTAAYMSPEQARGMAVDKRTDIWAFGVILYEMLTGEQMFDGPTVSDKLAAILTTDPDWTKLPTDTPPRIRELLERCLARPRQDRLQDIGDARVDIAWTLQGRTGEVRAMGAAPRSGGRGRMLAGAIALAAVVGVAAWNLAPRTGGNTSSVTTDVEPLHLSMQFDPGMRFGDDVVAPDGTVALFARYGDERAQGDNRWRLFLRAPDDRDLREVEGSAGVNAFCFSPDSKWLAMISPDQSGASGRFLWKVPVDGHSPPLRVRTWPQEWTSTVLWLRDGRLVTTTHDNQFIKLSSDGELAGEPVKIVSEGFTDRFRVQGWAASEVGDGVHVLTSVEAWTGEGYAVHVVIANMDTGEARILMRNGASPHWIPPHHLLFSRGTTVLASRVDPGSFEVRGAPVAVADGLRLTASWMHGNFGLSEAGMLFYLPGGLVGQKQRLVWTDTDFAEFEPWSNDLRHFDGDPMLSPDGRHVAIIIAGTDGVFETWISDVNRPGWRRFAWKKAVDCVPEVWTPDSRQLVCRFSTSSGGQVVLQPVDSSIEPTVLVEHSSEFTRLDPRGFTDAGRSLVFGLTSEGQNSVVWLDLDDSGSDLSALRELVAEASQPTVSPDGQWISYFSAAAGRRSLVMRRWLGGGRLGPEINVLSSENLGSHDWYRPGPSAPLQLWYFQNHKLYAVTVTTEPELVLGEDRFLMESPRRLAGFSYDSEGRILGRMLGEDEDDPERFDVILNWLPSIRERLPR